MQYIPTNVKINLEWSVKKGVGNEAEDFSRATVSLFLFSDENRWAVPCTADYTGVVRAEIPETLPEGVYSLDLLWIKNEDSIQGTRCLQRTRKTHVFAIDASASPSQTRAIGPNLPVIPIPGQPVTVKMSTVAAPYGYDGLSAYEAAILYGMQINISEKEWAETLYNYEASEASRVEAENIREANEAERIANEEVRMEMEDARETNEDERKTEEAERLQSEAARNLAESTRNAQETLRETAERNRAQAEQVREANEVTREANESKRIEQEETRRENEATRQKQEGTKDSKDQESRWGIFNNAEDLRQTNEVTRKANETAREANEAIRQEGFCAFGHRMAQVEKEQEEFEQTIRKQVENYKPIVINGNVSNAADEEDITSDENNLLKLKDRNSLDGMGHIILRKNKTFAEQLTQTNTIYEIRYDFDLNGEEINIPEGCVLDFKGGYVFNGAINANKSELLGTPKLSVDKIGLLKNGYYNLSWFVDIDDYSTLIQDIIDKSYVGQHKNDQIVIYVPKGEYIISKLSWANPNTGDINTNDRFVERLTIRGEGTGSVININSGEGITLIDRFLIEDVVIIGAKIKPAIKIGKTSTIYPDGNSIINRCHFEGNTAGAIASVDFLLNLNITNCYFTNNNNKEGSVVSLKGQSSTTFRVTKCYFSNNNSAKHCLYLEGNTNINIHDNIFESSGLLIYAHSCNMLSIDSNYFEYATDYYLVVDKHSSHVCVTNNFFRYSMCDKPYISLNNTGIRVIENNKFEWWGNRNVPAKGYITGTNITNLKYNNNTLSVRTPQTTRFEDIVEVNSTTRNLKLYSSFQNGSSETGYPQSSDSDNYVEFVDNFGYADNKSYKVRLTSKLLKVPNTEYTYKSGKRYVVSFYLKFTEESKDNTVELLFTGAAGIAEALISQKGTDWQRYQFEILQDVGNINAAIYFNKFAYSTGPCEFYIDDVQIEQKESGFAGEYILNNDLAIANVVNNLGINNKQLISSFKVNGQGWYRILELDYVPIILSLDVYKSYTYSPFECQHINIGCRNNTSHYGYSMFSPIFSDFRIVKIGTLYYIELYHNTDYVNEICITINNFIPFADCKIIPVVKDKEYDSVHTFGRLVESISKSGTTPPNNVSVGARFYRTDLNRNTYAKSIDEHGNVVWVDGNGDNPTFQHDGTFDKKPKEPNVGFHYYCTDRHTEEGGINGIIIYHRGGGIWADALGRVVE